MCIVQLRGDNFHEGFETLSCNLTLYTHCSLLTKGQTPKRQAVQRLRM